MLYLYNYSVVLLSKKLIITIAVTVDAIQCSTITFYIHATVSE